MGEPSALGVIPQFANELYDRIEGTTDDEVSGTHLYLYTFLHAPYLSLTYCMALYNVACSFFKCYFACYC